MPIESKAAIKEAIDYMVKQDILEPQIKPTPWVSSVTYPVKPTGEVRPCLDARDLNKAIIQENHKPKTVKEIAHQLAGAVDHDANLINLLNVAQVEGLVLNSKKLELKCPRVSFFSVEYSADGMHPCLKKIQGITEMTPP